MPNTTAPEPVAPPWLEFDTMLATLSETAPDWTFRVAVIGRYLGARRTQLLALTWADVDVDSRRITFRGEITKGGYGGRTIPLHSDLVARMASWGVREGRLMKAPEAEYGRRGHVDRTIRRAWARAGIREEAWSGQPIHCTRKTIETGWAAAGVGQGVIDAYLGHAGVGTGPRYYRDRSRLWVPMQEAVETIPAIGTTDSLRLVGDAL